MIKISSGEVELKKNKNIELSIIINIIIVIFTTIACFLMFNGINFMHVNDFSLESQKIEMFKYFTVESNIFMGLTSFMFIIYELLYIKKKIKNIPKSIYLLKYMATISVSVTFFTVFLYLGPLSDGGIKSLLMNSNLFFHLFIPILSMLTFVKFEKNNKLKIKDTLYGMIPTLLYSMFYLTNIIIHMDNNHVSTEYDWYWFVQSGIKSAFIVIPAIYLLTYILCFFFWKLNKNKA